MVPRMYITPKDSVLIKISSTYSRNIPKEFAIFGNKFLSVWRKKNNNDRSDRQPQSLEGRAPGLRGESRESGKWEK